MHFWLQYGNVRLAESLAVLTFMKKPGLQDLAVCHFTHAQALRPIAQQQPTHAIASCMYSLLSGI